MSSADTDRMYMCIDLKSFYASVECADLGVDPFTTPLVVADNSRGKGAITLAISPALKKLGVKNRSRLFQIPSHIEYITVKPHMKRYMQASAQIYGTLLNYISPEMCIRDRCYRNRTRTRLLEHSAKYNHRRRCNAQLHR